MTLGERQSQLELLTTNRERPRVVAAHDCRSIEAADLDIGALEVRLELRGICRDDRDSTGRQRRYRLGVCFRNTLDRAHELEVLWPDRGDDDDVRPCDRAQLGDLTKPSHSHLRHEHLGLGLEPADGEWEPDLVVLARLRPDRRHGGSAECAEDVLRRGLTRRTDDGDDASAALRANEPSECGKRCLLVIRNERRCAPRARHLDEIDASVEGDEELARPDESRVCLDRADRRRRTIRWRLESAESKRHDLVPKGQDHRYQPRWKTCAIFGTTCSHSRFAKRSSWGCLPGAVSPRETARLTVVRSKDMSGRDGCSSERRAIISRIQPRQAPRGQPSDRRMVRQSRRSPGPARGPCRRPPRRRLRRRA